MTNLLLVCFLWVMVTAEGDTWVNREHRLYDSLMSNYTKYIRPVANASQALEVKFGITLVTIENLDEKLQALTSNVWLKIQWNDVQLKWNPLEHENMRDIRMPIDQLWTPDLTLFNSMGPSDYGVKAPAVVYDNGNVLWIPPVQIRSSCIMDMTHFPFDQQLCQIKFGSWSFHGFQIDLVEFEQSKDGDIQGAQSHMEWEIMSYTHQKNAVYYACCPEPYHDITYNLTLKRRATHVSTMFLAPSVTTIFVLPAVFLLPAESGDKFVLGIGVLISQVLLLGMLDGFIPASHPSLPRIGMYYLGNIVIISLSLAISAVIVNLWHRSGRKTAMPGFVRTCFLVVLGRLLCVPRDDYMPVDDGGARRMDDLDGENVGSDRTAIVRNFDQVVSASEWRQLSVVLDRLFLILTLVLLIVVAVALGTF